MDTEERFRMFLPSVICLLGIAMLAFISVKLFSVLFSSKREDKEWCKKNLFLIYCACIFPERVLFPAALEEVVFRSWLVIFFSFLSDQAWSWIFIVSCLFTAVHWLGNVSRVKYVGVDDGRLTEQDMKRLFFVSHLFSGGALFLLSVLCGWLSVLYQSLWVSFAFHALWNFVVAPFVKYLVMPIFLIFFQAIFIAWEEYRGRLNA